MAPFLFLHHYMDATEVHLCLLPEKQPKFPKMHFAVAFSGNALGKAFKRATLIPQNAFYGCFFGKCRGVECVREVDNKSQSAFPVNAIIILKALEAVFE